MEKQASLCAHSQFPFSLTSFLLNWPKSKTTTKKLDRRREREWKKKGSTQAALSGRGRKRFGSQHVKHLLTVLQLLPSRTVLSQRKHNVEQVYFRITLLECSHLQRETTCFLTVAVQSSHQNKEWAKHYTLPWRFPKSRCILPTKIMLMKIAR